MTNMSSPPLSIAFSFSLLLGLLLASGVSSRPLLSSQSRMSKLNRRAAFPSAINMTSRADDSALPSLNERNSNGMYSLQHLKVAHSWLAGEGRRDLLGADLASSEPKDPAQIQAELTSGPQATLASSDTTSMYDIITNFGLSATGWDWTFPAPLQSALPTSPTSQPDLLLSQPPDQKHASSTSRSSDLESGRSLNSETRSERGLKPATSVRDSYLAPAQKPEETSERLELEKLNEEELDDGSRSFLNTSAIYSRSESETDSTANSKASSAVPNSALPTTQSGKYVSDWLSNDLNLYERRVLVGADNLNFVDSPTGIAGGTAPNNASESVLSVFYPKNSYSPSHSDPVGGVSFYAQPFSISPGSDAVNASLTSATASTSLNSRDSQPKVLIPALQSLPVGAANLLASTSKASPGFATSKPSLLLSYSVYFPPDFDFVKGGKLPGLYSSTGQVNASTGLIDANTDSCSGGAGDEAGESCWSVRLMWRANGEGEAYIYLPIRRSGQYDPCGTSESGNNGKARENWTCNNDFGVSLGRGKFTFAKGGWTDISLFVQLNSAPTLANGQLSLWSNGIRVLQEKNMLFRTGSKVVAKTGKGGGSGDNAKRTIEQNFDAAAAQTEGQWVDKVFFSSFFGGGSSDYAATSDTYTYFKDVSLHAGTNTSTLPGLDMTHASQHHSGGSKLTIGTPFCSIVSFVTLLPLIWLLL